MTLATIRADVAEVLRTLVLLIATGTVAEFCGVREQERARFPVTTMTLALWPRGRPHSAALCRASTSP